MLYIFRLIITVIYSILVCVFGSIYCLFSPRNPKHVATFGHMFGRLAPLLGLKVELGPEHALGAGGGVLLGGVHRLRPGGDARTG